MYSLPTAPRPMGGVLGDALRLYRASFSRCWSLALVGAVLSAMAGTYQTRSLGDLSVLSLGDITALSPDVVLPELTSRSQQMLHSRGLWLSSLALLVVWLVICAALIGRQHAAAVGRTDSTGAAFAFALRRLPSALAAGLVWALLTVAGLLLLVIPGLWLSGMFQLWFVPLCVEELGPLKALGRSWQLVERHWWYTSTVVGVAVTVVALLSMAADLVAGVFVGVSHGTAAAFLPVSALLGAAVSLSTMPLLTAVMLSVYYDLKLRREGGDLAVRLRSLQRA